MAGFVVVAVNDVSIGLGLGAVVEVAIVTVAMCVVSRKWRLLREGEDSQRSKSKWSLSWEQGSLVRRSKRSLWS